jgi:hypothetical protein
LPPNRRENPIKRRDQSLEAVNAVSSALRPRHRPFRPGAKLSDATKSANPELVAHKPAYQRLNLAG